MTQPRTTRIARIRGAGNSRRRQVLTAGPPAHRLPWLALKTLAAAAALWLAFRRVDLPLLWHTLHGASPPWVALSLAAVLLALASAVLRWRWDAHQRVSEGSVPSPVSASAKLLAALARGLAVVRAHDHAR